MKPPVLAIFLLVLHAQGVRADGVSAADDAFAAGLWEVAALRYEARLAGAEMPAAERQGTALRLAESLVRQGDTAKAMVLLEQSWIEPSPERAFWIAQALAGSGRFADAVRAFRELLETGRAGYPEEAAFTCANLQLSLGLPEDALATLEAIGSPAADLQRAAICLDLGRHGLARALLPADDLRPSDQPFAALLDARLLLAEDKPEAAAAAFKALIDSPKGQSRSNHHAAVIGYADAQAVMGAPGAAAASLLSFIQSQPDTPLLDAMFKRLHEWLPDMPAASDPVLERLAQWIPPAQVPVTGLIAARESSAGAWPQASSAADLTTFALFTRGVGLHRVDDPASKHEARQLLKRLLLENPGHFLAGRALLEIGRWHLQDGRIGPAMHLFAVVRENAKAPRLRGESAFLEARAAYDAGKLAEATALFDEAAADLDAQAASAAVFNAAVIRLESGGTAVVPQAGEATEDRSLIADLKLERALVLSSPEERRAAIEEFLINHPAHPRVPEARLAAAEAALLSSPPDASFAGAQLDTLDAMRGDGPPPPSARSMLARLRIADLTNDSRQVVALAGSLLENHAEDPAAAEASLTLGRHLFQSGSYNDARLVFERLAGADPDANRAQAAWLLAARSAALSATAQSREEALGRFDKAIEIDGPARDIARLEKARLMIDLNRLPEAVDFLRGWIAAMPEEDVLKLPAGLLLGEAVYAQGAANPEALEEALAIYDDLLEHSREQPALLHRLQYLRGMTLEQLPRKDDPTRKREAEALDAYFSVFDAAAADPPPAEWEWFERCGFRALGILENAQRWEAAIAVAQKIASFKGPRAEEAATRASQLQLKHMIWED